MSRCLRSVLPSTSKQLRPQVVRQETVRTRREACQQRQKMYYDRTARPLSTLHDGDAIRFQQSDGHWKPATVIQPAGTDRSYRIRTPEGQEYRRNRRHLLETKETEETDTGAPQATEPIVAAPPQQPQMAQETQGSPLRGSVERIIPDWKFNSLEYILYA